MRFIIKYLIFSFRVLNLLTKLLQGQISTISSHFERFISQKKTMNIRSSYPSPAIFLDHLGGMKWQKAIEKAWWIIWMCLGVNETIYFLLLIFCLIQKWTEMKEWNGHLNSCLHSCFSDFKQDKSFQLFGKSYKGE